MKRMLSLCAAALCLTLALTPTALAADFEPAVPDAKVCYPTSIVRNDDGTELKKIYDLSPEDDPAGIPRSDFRQDGFQYTLTDLLKQELPENESRQHTEHVSIESAKKDMESVLALLPQEREFITDDGLMGTLTLRLDTVQVEPSGYGSSTKQLSVKRSYPNLAEQDTQYIPKSIEDGGKNLTLSDIQWQTDNTANMDGYAVADRYTAVATYTGSTTSSYVKGYTVTADYTGTVSRIALNRVRYVAIFEGVPIQPAEPAKTAGAMSSLRWSYVLIPIGVVAAAGAGVGGALLVDSELGKGSVFTIRVPMSLSISDCMVIQLGGREYAVPVSAIKEIFRPKAEQLNVTPDGRETVLSDKLYRMIRLSEHFGLEGCESDPKGGIILLCTAESGEAALMADGILEEMQIAIKPFSAYLSKFGLKEAGFSGTSVLGDGSIIPVLDVNEIIKKVSRK